jgi:hypothetical protein
MYYVLHSTYFKLYLCYVIKTKTIKIKENENSIKQ